MLKIHYQLFSYINYFAGYCTTPRETNGNRCVGCNVCSPVLFASHVFCMKPNGSPNLPLHDCLTCAEPDQGRGEGGGGGGGGGTEGEVEG